MAFDRETIKAKAAELASQGVLYWHVFLEIKRLVQSTLLPGRYEYRGKVATTRFEQSCLAEYAEVFKTVCVDAAYYTFPRVESLQGLADQVPDDFRFGFKVTDNISIKKFPN